MGAFDGELYSLGYRFNYSKDEPTKPKNEEGYPVGFYNVTDPSFTKDSSKALFENYYNTWGRYVKYKRAGGILTVFE